MDPEKQKKEQTEALLALGLFGMVACVINMLLVAFNDFYYPMLFYTGFPLIGLAITSYLESKFWKDHKNLSVVIHLIVLVLVFGLAGLLNWIISGSLF